MAAATSPELILIGIYLACHSDSPNFPHLPAKAGPQSRDAMDAVVVKVEASYSA